MPVKATVVKQSSGYVNLLSFFFVALCRQLRVKQGCLILFYCVLPEFPVRVSVSWMNLGDQHEHGWLV